MTPRPILGSVPESTSLCLGSEGHAARCRHSATAVRVLEIPFVPGNIYDTDRDRQREMKTEREIGRTCEKVRDSEREKVREIDRHVDRQIKRMK